MKYDKSNKTEHDIKKDGLDESQPSGGKSAEDVRIAADKWFSATEWIDADKNSFADGAKWMQEQYAHQQPVQGYSREDIIALLDWLTKEDSPYAVCYGSETRFATNQDDLTTEQVFEVWNKIYGHIQQPVNDGWVRVDSGELPDYRLVVDVYKSHHNVVEPAARLSTDITGEKWSCEYGHYITHWRLRPEPPKQTV